VFNFWERFRTGFTATSDCWKVIREDKRLLILPLWSGIFCLLVLASFVVPIQALQPQVLQALIHEHSKASATETPIWFWVLLFAFYFCNYAVMYFFNAALIHCALFHFRGIPIRVGDGLRAALHRLPLLLAWALVSATVGVLLRMLESSHEKVRGLIDRLLGSTWTILTYFVVPVLVVERVGPFRAIQRSVMILRETWGEALGGRVGIGWFMLPFWLLAMACFYVGFRLYPAAHNAAISIFALTGIYCIILGLINSALETILLAGLYLYATQDEVPEQMDKAVLDSAFEVKE
jgi:ABC-type multidrug transport system fused ATPase/permease subunit